MKEQPDILFTFAEGESPDLLEPTYLATEQSLLANNDGECEQLLPDASVLSM